MAKFYKFNDNLAANVDWRITDQTTMRAWRTKGLQDGGKDLILRKCLFYGMVGGITIMMLMLFSSSNTLKEDILPIILPISIVVSFFYTLIYLSILGGDVFNYRLTETSFEQANWNDYIPFVKKISQIPLCVIAIAVVFMVVTDPTIILGAGLGGMVGIGLMAGLTLYSKSYEKNNLNYQFFSTDWSLMAYRVEIDKKRRIVLFWATNLNHKNQNITMFSVFYTIFNRLLLDNAVVEHFFGSLKNEGLGSTRMISEEQLQVKISKYIHYYNMRRPHS